MIRFLHIGRREPAAPPSAFRSTLERVREMREHTDWQPLTPPSSIDQRANRVTQAREHVRIPPLGHEFEKPKTGIRYFHTAEFWRPILYSIAAFTAFGLAFFVWGPEWQPELWNRTEVKQASIVFPTSAYTNLTQSVAERFARRAILAAGRGSNEWDLLSSYYRIDGAVVVWFGHNKDNELLGVTVSLQSTNSRIVCEVQPQ